jgi:hypothetical protein
MEEYCVALPKSTRKPIPSLWYAIIEHHRSTLFEGYYSWPKLINTSVIPFAGYPINTLGSITYILKLGRVFITLLKFKNKVILC